MRYIYVVILLSLQFSCSIQKKIKDDDIGGIIDGRYDTIEYIDTSYRIVNNLDGHLIKYKEEMLNDSIKSYDFSVIEDEIWTKSINVVIDIKTGRLVSLKIINPKIPKSLNIESDSTNQFRFKD